MSGCLNGCNDTSRHGVDAGSTNGNNNGPRRGGVSGRYQEQG
jgi:hypothetical protein